MFKVKVTVTKNTELRNFVKIRFQDNHSKSLYPNQKLCNNYTYQVCKNPRDFLKKIVHVQGHIHKKNLTN